MMRSFFSRRNNGFPWIEAVPSLPRDTYVYYGGPYFVPERKELHEEILNHLLSGCNYHQSPKAIMMMGGPASGKSSALKAIPSDDFIHLDSDAIKAMLPEYQEAIAQKAKNAAAMVHEESAFLVDQATEQAIAGGCNLIYDGTGKNAAKYAKLMSRLHDAGYSVQLIYVHVDPAIALPRAIKRAEKTGRYVPEYVIEQAYASIPYNFGSLANQADAWMMFDTSQPPAKMVASKEVGKSPVVHEIDVFNQFLTNYPQKTSLRLNPRIVRHKIRLNPDRIEDALNRYLRAGADDGDTGLSD